MKNLSLPNPNTETPCLADSNLQKDINHLLNDCYQAHLKKHESISVIARFGDNASYLNVQVGDNNRAHVFEFFMRDCRESDLNCGLDFLIDYLDGILLEFFEEDRNAFFPLDFTPRDFASYQIWARHEFHDFKAESLALELLKKS
jgi:hypothetical protein